MTVIIRHVEVFEYEPSKTEENSNHYLKRSIGFGSFHGFGKDYEELEGGACEFTTAIVEMNNGEVKNIPVGLIKFMDK